MVKIAHSRKFIESGFCKITHHLFRYSDRLLTSLGFWLGGTKTDRSGSKGRKVRPEQLLSAFHSRAT